MCSLTGVGIYVRGYIFRNDNRKRVGFIFDIRRFGMNCLSFSKIESTHTVSISIEHENKECLKKKIYVSRIHDVN